MVLDTTGTSWNLKRGTNSVAEGPAAKRMRSGSESRFAAAQARSARGWDSGSS